MNFWQFAAGIGLFLLGIHTMESAIRSLVGRSFRDLIQKSTQNRFAAVLNGAVAAAILQSSSIVIVSVIAFTGAQILPLSNGLGVVLGANLGTTMTGWLINWLGFSSSSQGLAFPALAVGCLGLLFFSNGSKAQKGFQLVSAFGLVLLGLQIAKEATQNLTQLVDLTDLQNNNAYLFFPIGFVLTALIQSSTAMMAITLTALNAGAIELKAAALIAVGADLGTTVTALIASFNGSPVKKRVGLAHVLINVVTAIIALIFMNPLLNFLQADLGLQDATTVLVGFHSLFNLLGIVVMLPLLGALQGFLETLWKTKQGVPFSFISSIGVQVPSAALSALRKDLNLFLKQVGSFNMSIFKFEHDNHNLGRNLFEQIFRSEDHFEKYRHIKQTEAEVLHFIGLLQTQELTQSEASELSQLTLALRKGVESAKSLRDIEHNLVDLEKSSAPFATQFDHLIESHYHPLFHAIYDKDPLEFEQLNLQNEKAFQSLTRAAYKEIASEAINSEIPSLLNITRELHSSFKAAIEAHHLVRISSSS